jgi:hypothetical protein
LPRFATTATSGVQEYTSTPPILSKTGLVIGELQFEQQTGVPIYQYTLNPFANPSGYSWSTLSNYADGFVGHDIDIIGRGIGYSDGVGTSGLPMTWSKPGSGVASGQADYANDYRMFALRGPLVVQGWGYTTDGYPIPNQSDNESDASVGKFVTSSVPRFLDGWLQKSHTWPVGPVDLRWDNERNVWSFPPNVYELTECLVPEQILSGDKLWISTSTGYNDTLDYYYNEGYYLEAPLYDIPSGTTVLARYDGTNTRAIIDTDIPRGTVLGLATLSGVLSEGEETIAYLSMATWGVEEGPIIVHDWLLRTNEQLNVGTKVVVANMRGGQWVESGVDYWVVIQASCATTFS